MGELFALALLLGMGCFIFVDARVAARRSPAKRRKLLVGNALRVALGAFVALWLPRYVPETPGSLATLLAVVLLWLLGGVLGLGSLLGLLGALWSRPRADQRQ